MGFIWGDCNMKTERDAFIWALEHYDMFNEVRETADTIQHINEYTGKNISRADAIVDAMKIIEGDK